MKKDFDLGQIGKKMPYTTPTMFFDEMEENVWDEVRHELDHKAKRKKSRLRAIISATAVAASLALAIVLSKSSHEASYTGFTSVEQAFANLSGEDQTYMLEVYQEDIFLNN